MQTLTSRPAPERLVPSLFAAWALASIAIATTGVLTTERRAFVPLVFASLLGSLIVGYRRWPALRAFADGVDLRVPIAFHLLRIPFGAAFLVLESRGELDPLFAIRAGWGDILAGTLALVAVAVLTAAPRATRAARASVWTFNVVGLLDILMVFATAQYLLFFSGHPETMAAIGRFPMPTIPLFVLPVIFATHFLIFRRLLAADDQRDS